MVRGHSLGDVRMYEFASNVWSVYLDKHFPASPMSKMGLVGADSIAGLFWEISSGLDTSGMRPIRLPKAVEGADRIIYDMALDGHLKRLKYPPLDPDVANELMLRIDYARLATALESAAATGWSVQVPVGAPEKIYIHCIVLYVLAGPAKDIPQNYLRVVAERSEN